MADFYSPMLTENADGTPTDWHSLGSSQRSGLQNSVHNIFVNMPATTDLNTGDKIVLAIVPADFKLHALQFLNTAFITGSTAKTGIFLVNNDGTVGAKASAASDVIFETTRNLLTPVTTRVDKFTVGALDDFDRGKQMWELVNEVNAGTYPESPGGNFAIALEIIGNPAVTAVAQSLQCWIEYNEIN